MFIIFLLYVGTMMLQYMLIYFLDMLLFVEELGHCLELLQAVMMSEVLRRLERVHESQQGCL